MKEEPKIIVTDSTSISPSVTGGTASGTSPSPLYTPLMPNTLSPTQLAQLKQVMYGQGVVLNQAPKYQSQMINRVSIPINSIRWGRGRLEMSLANASQSVVTVAQVELTLLLPGREAIDFSIHPEDLDGLMSQRTLDKLAK